MKKLVCIILTVALMIPSYLALAFDDVGSDHWAKEYIDNLSEKGVINGYEDKTFRPEGNVTKGEFAKILCLSFELSDKGIKFDDMKGHWAEKYANIAGAVMYTKNSVFDADTAISRAEIAYALSNVLSLPEADKTIDQMFSDPESVEDILSKNVAASAVAGLIEGYENGEIRGKNSVTRAEACALIIRALNYKATDKEEDKAPQEDVEEEEKAPEKEENKEEKPNSTDTSGLEHIYTLVPAKNLILVTSARKTIDSETQNDAIRLTYFLAGDDTEYSSTIVDDDEIDIIGARENLEDIKKGDILLTDSGFLRHIDRIFVLSALGDSINQGKNAYIPEGSKIGPKGSDKKYEIIAGKIESRKTKDKAIVVTLENGEIVSVPRSVDINIYHPMLKTPWETASPTAIETENAVLFARYTDGVVTDAIVAIYE